MCSIPFYLVDAFTEESFKGNPAGVCLVDEYPDAEVMQSLARYYDWSEIAFVKHIERDRYYIRWFSPLDEAPLCGHATLAAAHILFRNGVSDGYIINFAHNTGTIQAQLNEDSSVTMLFDIKPVYRCKDIPFSVEKIIGIKKYKEVFKDDLLYVVVLESSDDVSRAVPNFEAIKQIEARAVAITGPNTGIYDFSSRYFAPRVGIYEDPVCGSMHCRLAHYWRQVTGKTRFRAYQASHRSGILDTEIEESTVKLTGKAVVICEFTHYPKHDESPRLNPFELAK
jgi:PhzF family phenazine biosynthesis protein